MQTLSEIKAILHQRDIRPKHRFGQNFLHDQNLLRRLVEVAAIERGECVLEVGPGTGTLTEALLDAGASVIACEIDRDLASILRERLGNRIELIEGDCLAGKHALNPTLPATLNDRPFKLVSNLPYNVASPLMINLLVQMPCQLRGMFVTIQREVADRLAAHPSTRAYGPLTVVVRAFATVEKVATLPPSCFWPQPEVTSAMVVVRPHDEGKASTMLDRASFGRFVAKLFSKRRKQIKATLGESVAWPEGVDPGMRPEALGIEQFVELFRLAGGDETSS